MVKTCAACGLPAPSSTLACALCSQPFPGQGPVSYRLTAHDDGYRWLLDGEEVAAGLWRDGTWNVVDSHSGKIAVTLIGVATEGRTKVAMVDHLSRVVATFTPAEPGVTSASGVVRDSYDQVLMAVRADGPTGVHVIDTSGQVLALASRLPVRTAPGLDLLLTRVGASRRESILFGLSLALELLRVGDLHGVSP